MIPINRKGISAAYIQGKDRKVGRTNLQSGQLLYGTGWRLKHSAELFVYREDPHISQWLKESFDNFSGTHVRTDTDVEPGQRLQHLLPLPSISLETQDVKRWEQAWQAPLTVDERRNSSKIPLSARDYETTLLHRCADWPDVKEILKLPSSARYREYAARYTPWHGQQISIQISNVSCGGYPHAW